MNYKLLGLGAFAYIAVTFPLAIIWHIVLFKPFYVDMGYLPENPSFILGFAAIVIQGILLTWGFSFTRFKGSIRKQAIKYTVWLGIFFWSSHVIALMAKSPSARSVIFLGMESFYLLLQFGIYGILLGLIYQKLSDNVS